MSGNLCRCGAYANIVPAIRQSWRSADEAVPLRARRRRAGAVAHARRAPDAAFLAGGTNLVDL